jgi:anti-anti-sigma factor
VKPHLTLARIGHRGGETNGVEAVVDRRVAFALDAREDLQDWPVVPAVGGLWRHTLILTGELDGRSAPELEDEIECLCQEGVTSIALDMRRLDAMDPMGVQAVAFLSGLYRGQGCEFVVIAGSRVVHHALTEAGATDLLMPGPIEDISARRTHRSGDALSRERWTATVKDL